MLNIRMKKSAIILTVLLGVSALVSCGGNKEEATVVGVEKSVAPPVANVEGETVMLDPDPEPVEAVTIVTEVSDDTVMGMENE